MSDAEDDLEALFDQISAQHSASDAPPAAEPATTMTAPAADAADPAAQAAANNAGGALAGDPAANAEREIYERVGGILRMLHDSLSELGLDRALSDVAHHITDAQNRLEHIATLTEQAANKVLNTVDNGIPEQEALGKQAQDMDQRWSQLFQGQLGIEEFKTLAGDSKQFAATVMKASDAEKARLLDIMMAQDFQDITGQLIKKILNITSTAERELAQLLRDNAPPEMKAAMAEHNKQAELMNGPSAPSVAMAQDDVDSLLADLGF